MALSRLLVGKMTNSCVFVSSTVPHRRIFAASVAIPSVSYYSSSALKEIDVLNQLSDLLPIRSTTAKLSSKKLEQKESNVCCITPEEKLRGVYLQKLNGRFLIEMALSDAGVDLNLDVVSGVLSEGNLGGDAMISFFNWAIKQPDIPYSACSYNILLGALGKKRYVNFIEKVLLDMRKNGIKLNHESWSIVMFGFIHGRRVNKAIEVFEKCEDFGFKRGTNLLNVLLKCMCENSHVNTAHSYMNSLKGKAEFDATTYNILISGWATVGRVAKIKILMKEMRENGFSFDCLTFCYLIAGLGKAGRIDEALETFEKMECNGYRPDVNVYNSMIQIFASCGELEKATKLFPCHPTVITFEILIVANIKARRVFDALELFDKMLESGIRPPSEAVTLFVDLLCSFGPPDAANTMVSKARTAGCKISLSTYKVLLRRLSRFGKCGSIAKLCDDMSEDGHAHDAEMFEFIINGHCNDDNLGNAVVTMEAALEKGFCPNKIVCSKVFNKLLKSGNVVKAYRLFLKVKIARRKDIARKFWRRNGWHF